MPQPAQRRSVFFAPALRGAAEKLRRSPLVARHSHDDAVLDAAGSLAYYASQLPGKESWFQTDEGYRIYKNTPIARTGVQQYLGREIKRNRGYRPEWSIGDDELVTVFRPYEEVTHPATIASFEGKSVLDEHPEGDKVLIDALDEYDGYTQGHGHNVRVGPTLDDGETSLIADVWVKHPDLNDKIDSGIRDISCGYTFLLDKDQSGRYIQRKIRGNHIAVVPLGRAGSDVGIGDAAPSLTTSRSYKMPLKPSVSRTSPLAGLFLAAGFQNWVKDAKPEEVAEALSEMGVKDAEPELLKKDKDEAKDKKGAKDAEGDDHPEGCRCKDCTAAKDAEDHPKNCKCDDCSGAGDDADDMDGDGPIVDKKKGAKDEAEILSDEAPESLFSVADAAAQLRKLKPLVARSKDQGVKDAYAKLSRTVRSVQNGVKDGVEDPFVALASPRDGATDAGLEPEQPMFMFFNGVPHHEGVKRWNEYQESRQRR